MVVASKHILARQIDLLVWNADVGRQPYDRWEGESCADRSDIQVRSFFDDLGLCQNNEQHCLLRAADANGFVGLIEHQYSRIERDLPTRVGGRGCDAGQCDRWCIEGCSPFGSQNIASGDVFSPTLHHLIIPGTSMQRVPAVLALENGVTVTGHAIGAIGAEASGELVFNTAMTGYQEVLTDPSYKGQIVTFTYPHIGNYGVNPEDIESDRIQASGLVVHELSRTTSNWRATRSLQSYLEEAGVAGIDGIDTRRIVRILRSEGAMRCVIAHGEGLDHAQLVERARAVPDMNGLDLTPLVTTTAPYRYQAEEGSAWGYANPAGDGRRHKVTAIDFGIKRNILRQLAAYGCDVTVLPATATAADVLATEPDGIFLSNGPGDPAAVTQAIATVRELIGTRPIFGICLGHQILALAVGAQTYKLTFGHRGANHPVKNLDTGAIEITSQNHGFAVDPATLPANARVTHVNLNDQTCSGIALTDAPAFAVQYHPEASPGPHDSDYLFRQFTDLMAGVSA